MANSSNVTQRLDKLIANCVRRRDATSGAFSTLWENERIRIQALRDTYPA